MLKKVCTSLFFSLNSLCAHYKQTVYFKLLCDRQLVAYFEGYDLRRLKIHQKTFLLLIFSNKIERSEAFYDSFRRTHQPLGLTVQHFDIFASYLLDIFAKINVKDELMEEVLHELRPFRDCFLPLGRDRAKCKSGRGRLVRGIRKTISAPALNATSESNRSQPEHRKGWTKTSLSPMWCFVKRNTANSYEMSGF